MTKHPIEVITSVKRRRRWSREDKERLVAACFEPDAVISEIARAAGIHVSQLFRWRKELCRIEEPRGSIQFQARLQSVNMVSISNPRDRDLTWDKAIWKLSHGRVDNRGRPRAIGCPGSTEGRVSHIAAPDCCCLGSSGDLRVHSTKTHAFCHRPMSRNIGLNANLVFPQRSPCPRQLLLVDVEGETDAANDRRNQPP
ncbi:transposase [Agrobacterium tumefaciens]|uniref:transposase n=1 Tax=Agrobacterium tumefaciens TaxID=358 RepID=UPI0015718ECB|nr:transposase [Agrobacterium tumefaciens]NTA84505.1 transposase [Agrobacterium tumefaciens]